MLAASPTEMRFASLPSVLRGITYTPHLTDHVYKLPKATSSVNLPGPLTTARSCALFAEKGVLLDPNRISDGIHTVSHVRCIVFICTAVKTPTRPKFW